MQFDVYTAKGKQNGQVSASDEVFGVAMNAQLVSQALNRQQSNSRIAIAHTKTRSEVKCSTKKIYRQKGTGNARHGARSANLFRGGGVIFGPRNVQNWAVAMPKKQRRKAFFCTLSDKAARGKIFVLEGYEGPMKTKSFMELLAKLPVQKSLLLILDQPHEILIKASANVPMVKTSLYSYLNIEEVLQFDTLVFVGDALKKFEAVFVPSLHPTV